MRGKGFSLAFTMLSVLIILIFTNQVKAENYILPDTGQTKCYDDTGQIICPQPGEPFYGQDGSYSINPPSYTKLDSTGNVLSDDATTWVTVRDNVTGLIWELKQNKNGIKDYSMPQDADNTYTWYDSNPETNGGNAGTPGDGTDTEDFINALNADNFGGFSDWRLPTRKELRSIVNHGNYNPSIDTASFPNTQSSDYWSSTTFASATYAAWPILFYLGNDINSATKSSSTYVRAVRGKESQKQFLDNQDGTITDTSTGLMWQQVTGLGTYSWAQALSYCENLTHASHSDWRLPTIKELDSIVDLTRSEPAINTTFYPDTISSFYWASTTGVNNASSAWGMLFQSMHIVI